MKLSIPTPNSNQKVTIFDTYIRLMLLLPLTTLFQFYLPFINVALFIIVFMFQGLVILQKINKRSIVFMAISLISYVIVLMQTKKISFENQYVYFINWLMFSTVMAQNKDRFMDWLKNNEFYIKMIMFLWTLLVGFSIFLPSSYYSKEGTGNYFCSYTENIFRLAPTALFIQCLALISILLYKQRKDIIYMLVPLYAGFMGNSRTYFVLIVIVFLFGLYFFSSTKLRFWLMAIPTGLVGLLIYSMSAMREKVKYTLDDSQYGDLMFRLSSSRSLLWERIMVRYNKLPFNRKFFGSGFGYTNRINHGLYAHNDFVEILATHGIFGLILYLFCFVVLFVSFFKGKKIPIVMVAACVFIWIFNAMFNMFYWYTCAAFSFPFLLSAMVIYRDENPIEKRRNRRRNNDTESDK